MQKQTRGLIAVLVVAGAAFAAFKLFRKPSKTKQIQFLIDNNYSKGTPAQLLLLGDDYILAWYEAAKDRQTSFVLNGTTYNTQGGMTIK